MSIEMRVVFNNFPRIKKAAQVGARRVITKYSDLIRDDIYTQMNQPKSGRVYRGKSGRRPSVENMMW